MERGYFASGNARIFLHEGGAIDQIRRADTILPSHWNRSHGIAQLIPDRSTRSVLLGMSRVLHAAGAPEGITLNAEGALSLASSYMSAVGIEQWDIDAAVDNAYVNFDRSIRQIAVTLSFASTPLCDFFGPGGYQQSL